MSVSTRRRLPASPPPAPRPPVRTSWPVLLDPDEVTVARTALELGVAESLVWRWLVDAGELGRPMARRRSPGARIGERV